MTEKPELLYPPIYDEKTNATIYRVPLASPTGEAVLRNAEDDGYSIYIAEDLTDDQAKAKAAHAIEHIKNNDHEKSDVQQIEAEAHHIKTEEPPKKAKTPALRQKKKKRKFTAFELEQLRQNPFLKELLEIPEDEIPRKANDSVMSQERFEEIHEMMKKK